MNEEALGRGLREAFARVPDPRFRRGRRHPLPAILALATAAMLSGARSLYAIAQWGRLQDDAVIRALGFTRGKTPCVATLHLLFKDLDVAYFEEALEQWAQQNLGDRGKAIAIDGKGLRGIHGEEIAGVRLVAAYAGEAGLVLAQAGGEGRRARSGAHPGPRATE
jgi:hypothetical protein